jgi:hypothetical protein
MPGAPTRAYWPTAPTCARMHSSTPGVRRVGRAPEAKDLYERWLANMRRRVRLEHRRGALLERGSDAAARKVQASINRLKAAGNVTGQRFGLRVCSSNGPGRVPVPRD